MSDLVRWARGYNPETVLWAFDQCEHDRKYPPIRKIRAGLARLRFFATGAKPDIRNGVLHSCGFGWEGGVFVYTEVYLWTRGARWVSPPRGLVRGLWGVDCASRDRPERHVSTAARQPRTGYRTG